ncbi:MAG: hypothetical protein SangKO_050060 [Sandaracinaceae bacterium]
MIGTPDYVTSHLSELRELGFFDPSIGMPSEAPLMRRRQAGLLQSPGVGQLVLLDDDGVLHWELGRAPLPAGLGGRRSRPTEAHAGRVVLPLRFRELAPSEVWAVLETLDMRLSGAPGWLRWKKSTLVPAGAVQKSSAKRVLLFVHGTFSRAQAIVDGIGRSPAHEGFWSWATETYDEILFLNHHTLRPTPIANAMEIARRFDGTETVVHAIGHSRGCLVLRWWLEALDRGHGERRAVFVGGALGGTSLAAPPKLKAAVSLLTNVLRLMRGVVDAGSAILPPLAPLVGLLKVLSLATAGVGRSPIVDAGVALVPGLAAMSRVGNNAELFALRSRAVESGENIFAIQSDFEPGSPGWRFWRRFTGPGFADPASDAIFQGPNDLVVDTPSMVELADDLVISKARTLDFGVNSQVHHLNYFEQEKTIEKLTEWLG